MHTLTFRGLSLGVVALLVVAVGGSSAATGWFADAAAVRYGPLKGVGVSASQAKLTGRTVSVRVKLKRKAKLSFAVSKQKPPLGWKVTRALKPGTHTLTKRLSRVPTGSRLRLQITAVAAAKRGRGTVALTRVVVPVPSPSPTPTVTPRPTITPVTTPNPTPTPNRAPTALALSNATVPENQPAGTTIGTLSGTDPDAGATLTYALVAGAGDADNASFAISGAALQTAAVLDFETRSSYSVRVRVSDGAGGTFDRAFAITVTDTGEPPFLATTGTPLAYTEGAAAVPVDPGVTVTDTDDTNLESARVSIVTGFQADDELAITPQNGITGVYAPGTGILTLTGPSSVANYQQALRTVTYRHLGNAPLTSKTVAFVAGDGDSESAPAVRQISITPTLSPPSPVPDSYAAVGNTALYVGIPRPAGVAGKQLSGSVLANDTDPDSPPGSLVTEPVTGAATTLGGLVTIAADGTFVYQPGVGDTGATDTFTYRVCDTTPCTAAAPSSATATLSLPLTGQVWYLKNTATAGGDGTSDGPYDTLAELEAASSTGDTAFVLDGDNTSTNLTTGYAMEANERLIGAVSGLTVSADTLYPAAANASPTLTTTSAEDVVSLAAGVVLDGITVDPGALGGGIGGGAAAGGAPAGGVTLANLRVIDAGPAGSQPGIELNGTTGTNTVSNLVVSTTGAIGVRLVAAGTVTFAGAGPVSIATAGAKGLDVLGTNLGTSVFDDITVTGSANGGVSLVNTAGTIGLGDGVGTDLALTTTSGASPALLLNNAGAVGVDTAGNDALSATGGPALDVTGTPNVTLAFDDVSSTGSAGDGINLADLNTGTFTATGGVIAGAAGIAFDIDGGSGAITYPGTIGDGTGSTAEITGRSGGTVSLSGAIADGPDPGGAIRVVGNSGGASTFSNASKVLQAGTGDAVTFGTSNGHTLTFSGGGLDIDTTSGGGLIASDAGTLEISGTLNTIDTTTGTALVVETTDLGAAGATFQRLSSNGASRGVLLDTTGALGRLVVTGNGGTCTAADTSGCTGGRIRNAVGADDSGQTPAGTGIVLRNTLAPSLTRMWLHDHANYAIRGTDVAGLTLVSSVINGVNGTNGTSPFDDSSVWIDNLTGSAVVSATAISGGFEDNLRVRNASGSLDRLTISNAAFGLNSTPGGNDSVNISSTASASILKATIQNTTFTGAAGDVVQFDHAGSGAGDLVLSTNTVTNTHPAIATGGGGLSLFTGGPGGATTMNLTGNTFRDAVGPGVLIVKAPGTRTLTGTFANNSIGTTGVPNSGSKEGSALKLQMVDQGTSTWSVTGNTIRGYNNFGVEVLAGGNAVASSGTLNTTITGNNIAEPGTTAGTASIPKQGVHFNIGTVPGDTFLACAVLASNTLSTSGADATPPVGVNVDVRLRQRQTTTIRLPGYAGSATDTAAVQSFVTANNPGADVLTSVNSPPGGGFTGGGPATCP